MPYITSIERMAIRKGKQQGLQLGLEQGIERGLAQSFESMLRQRFGDLPEPVLRRIADADVDQLGRWIDRVLHAESLDALFAADSAQNGSSKSS